MHNQYYADYNKAIESFDAAIRFKSDYAEAYENRGITEQELGYYSDARSDFDAATRLNPAEETVRQAPQPAPTQPAPQPE